MNKVIMMILKFLPCLLRKFIFIKCTRFPPGLPKDCQIKVCTTVKEIEASLELVNEAYVETKLIDGCINNLKLSKFNLLPSSAVISMFYNNEVVATMTIIKKTSLGVPLSEIFDLSEVESRLSSYAEVSALAVRKKYRKSAGELMVPLMAFANYYGLYLMRLDGAVIAVHPKAKDYYRFMVGFYPISDEVKSYGAVKGAPAYGMSLDYSSMAWRNSPMLKYMNSMLEFFYMEEKRYYGHANRIFHLREVNYLLSRSRLMSLLDAETLNFIKKVYGVDDILSESRRRNDPFILIFVDATLYSGKEIEYVNIEYIQREYITIKMRGDINLMDISYIFIDVSRYESLKIKILEHREKKGLVHLKIERNHEWERYYDHLLQAYNSKKGEIICESRPAKVG